MSLRECILGKVARVSLKQPTSHLCIVCRTIAHLGLVLRISLCPRLDCLWDDVEIQGTLMHFMCNAMGKVMHGSK